MKVLILLISILFISNSFSYELIVVQGVSKEKQTFVTRNTEIGNKNIFEGKRATFTSENVSIIAKAITVTREFIQWEILNDFTDVPFSQGDIVTIYDSREYLWALTPELAKKKYFGKIKYRAQRSIEAQIFFSRGLSESVSGAEAQNVDRGGLQFEFAFKHELNTSFSLSYGIRYARDVANLPEVSIINTRLLGTFDLRYYFPPLLDFYNARIALAMGLGYGATRTEVDSLITAGNAVLLPSPKISLSFPLEDNKEIEVVGAIDSLRLDESNAEGDDFTTNLSNSKAGIIYRFNI